MLSKARTLNANRTIWSRGLEGLPVAAFFDGCGLAANHYERMPDTETKSVKSIRDEDRISENGDDLRLMEKERKKC